VNQERKKMVVVLLQRMEPPLVVPSPRPWPKTHALGLMASYYVTLNPQFYKPPQQKSFLVTHHITFYCYLHLVSSR
jgi:hypothetical protein